MGVGIEIKSAPKASSCTWMFLGNEFFVFCLSLVCIMFCVMSVCCINIHAIYIYSTQTSFLKHKNRFRKKKLVDYSIIRLLILMNR